MTDKKITDEEIIKGLECMLKMLNNNIVFSLDCGGCTFDNGLCSEICSKGLMKVTVDLIKRQKAEIERLKEENRIYIEANQAIGYQRDQRDKEIDELQKQIDGLDVRENKIKAEAYKEFSERLKIYSCPLKDGHDMVDTICIDNLLTEMVGEEE